MGGDTKSEDDSALYVDSSDGSGGSPRLASPVGLPPRARPSSSSAGGSGGLGAYMAAARGKGYGEHSRPSSSAAHTEEAGKAYWEEGGWHKKNKEWKWRAPPPPGRGTHWKRTDQRARRRAAMEAAEAEAKHKWSRT